MELIPLSCVLGTVAIFMYYVCKVLHWLWFEPKRKEKFLRDQGLNGTPYKFLFGDLKEIVQKESVTKLKTMYPTHNIAPDVSPFFYKCVTTHGDNYFTWMGPTPLHMVPAFYLSCNEMIHIWKDILMEESSGEVDVWPHLQTFAGDVISRTAFGSSYKDGRKIFELQKEQAELVAKAICSIYIPGLRFLPTKRNKRMKEIDREVRASIRSIIDKRVVEEPKETTHNDLLGILLESNYKEIKHDDNNDYKLSMDDIIEECKLFYFAGQETTATLLTWTMIVLGEHKDWQIRAREEVLHVFGKRKPDIDGMRHLKTIS
ncbi:hypothetical protein L1887_14531 [Cichorium endivia]|nr:hypothetical protein L1887_14531 [Cichorium endivia]